MNDFFLKVTELGLQASILILAVMILRRILRRTPRWMVCLLWGVVALRLLCPIQVESPLSLQPTWTRNIHGIMAKVDQNLLAKPVKHSVEAEELSGQLEKEIHEMDNSFGQAQKIASEAGNAFNLIGNPSGEGENSSPQMEYEKDQPNGVKNRTAMGWVRDNWVLALWLIGTCLMLCHAVVCFLPLRWSLRFAVRKYDSNLGTYFYESDAIADPFILGIARPKIYLPAGLCDSAREHILRHELAHLARGDYAWKPLGFLLLSVYWHFPLCWAGYYLFCRDMELACDEKVIRRMSRESRAEYCQVLLQMCAKRRSILASPVAFGEVGAGYRIRAILDYRMPKLHNLVASIILGTVACACLLTSPEGSASGDKDFDGIIGRLINPEQKTMDLSEGLSSKGIMKLGDVEARHFLEYDALFLEVPVETNSSCGFYCSCLHDNAIYFYDERNGEKAVWRRGFADGKEEVYLPLGSRERGISAMCFTEEGNLVVITRPDEGMESGDPAKKDSGEKEIGGPIIREYDGRGEKILEMPIKGVPEKGVFFDVARSAQGRTYLRMSDLDAPGQTLMELSEEGKLLKTETPNVEYVNGIGNTAKEGILLCDPRGLTLFDGTETEALLQWTDVGLIAHDVVAVCRNEDEIQVLTMDQTGRSAEIVLLRERR